MTSIKLVVLGMENVGKTSLINRFIQRKFIEKYDPTIEETFQVTMDVNRKALQVEVLDIGGRYDYFFLRDHFLQNGCQSCDGYILVYSVTDKNTSRAIKRLYEAMLEAHTKLSNNNDSSSSKNTLRNSPNRSATLADNHIEVKMPPIMIVGSKLDIAIDQNRRNVYDDEAQSLVDACKAIGYYETSSKDGRNVSEVFHKLVEYVSQRQPKIGLDEGCGGVFGAGYSNRINDLNSIGAATDSNHNSSKASIKTPQQQRKMMMNNNSIRQQQQGLLPVSGASGIPGIVSERINSGSTNNNSSHQHHSSGVNTAAGQKKGQKSEQCVVT